MTLKLAKMRTQEGELHDNSFPTTLTTMNGDCKYSVSLDTGLADKNLVKSWLTVLAFKKPQLYRNISLGR